MSGSVTGRDRRLTERSGERASFFRRTVVERADIFDELLLIACSSIEPELTFGECCEKNWTRRCCQSPRASHLVICAQEGYFGSNLNPDSDSDSIDLSVRLPLPLSPDSLRPAGEPKAIRSGHFS